MAAPASGRLALVTGGAGFIGSHLVDELLEGGFRVRVLDDFSSGRPSRLRDASDRVELQRGDVRDAAAVCAAAAGVDVVFHLAAVASVPRSIEAPGETNDVNLVGTLRVLEAARSCRVRRVVFASSSAVYGNAGPSPLRECGRLDPRSPYAVQKLAAEHYVRVYADLHDVETVSLRYFNVYGERQDPRSDYAAVIPRFLSAARAGEPLPVHGDGGQSRDFVHVQDVARANRLAADAPGVSGRCFNVATGRATAVNELVSAVGAAVGKRLSVRHEAPRPGDVRESRADVDAGRKVLGFEARVPLDVGIRRTLAWADALQEDPA